MNKILFLALIIGGGLTGGIMFYVGLTSTHLTELLYFTWIPYLISGGAWLFMIFKMWSAIQGEHARTSAGKAVGFLFIPFFNIYWIWVAYVGFSQDYNKYIQANNPGVTPLNVNMFMAQIILMYCSIIPFLGNLAMLASMIISIINIIKICDGVNALSGAKDPYQEAIS